MPDNARQLPPMSDLLKSSLLYQQSQALMEEVLKHKWYESEKAGHDIGYDRALTDWIIKYRSQWMKQWKLEHLLEPVRCPA
jgi:Domain of unknown function (DUF4032)